MNKRMVCRTTGYILMMEAALMLLPAIVASLYDGRDLGALLLSAAITGVAGFCMRAVKPRTKSIYAREGFAIVALSWILMSVFGSLPFIISGAIPNVVDALFETVSGFSTTGATILNRVELLSHGLLFWRSFTHWIGGMGVLVFVLVILPLGGERNIHLVRAEVPGPTKGKLVPKMRNTAKILYAIYCGMTLLEVILLCCGGMSVFDAFIHAFGTAGTGGFSSHTESIAYFNSAYIDTVIGVFMLLFGVNFNLYYLLLIKQGRQAFKNEELKYYFAIVAVAVLAISLNLIGNYPSYLEALRHSFFQVSSIMTTTGYVTADFNVWPQFARALLVLLMFIGACASSTGGGMKVSRCMLLYRMGKRGIKHMIHPRSVATVHMDDRPVDEGVLRDACVYLVFYLGIAGISVVLLSFDNLSFETNFSAMAACINNVGPGLDIVGATGNYAGFSVLSKIILSFDMLVGRLEIFPILILFAPSIWKRNAKKR